MDRAMPSAPKQSRHQEQLNEMHDALYQLGDQVRPPMGGSGSNLLPSNVVPEKPGAAKAKKHIDRLHKAFKALKKGKEK
jgi:hypothetical protein